MNQNQFVVLPKKENGELLQKYEILIYVCIRRYMNKSTMEAFPSLDTIAKDSGCSKPTVKKTINSIRDKGYFTIVPTNRGTKYIFSNEKSFEPFSYEFLDRKDISKSEKLQILCTQQYMYKNNGIGKISFSNVELSKQTGLNRRTIIKNNASLMAKGFASQISLKTRDEAGFPQRETIYYLDKLGQAIVFSLQKHEEEIDNLKKDYETIYQEYQKLLKENKSMSKDIANLSKQLSSLTKQINEKLPLEFEF